MTDILTSLPTIKQPRRTARILVVDDVPRNLTAMQAVLEPLGQELVLVQSGDEALRQLLHGDFALILMDVQMPGLNGLETAHIIRSRERTRHIPIIFITALSREAAYVTRGYAEGGVDYLMKPVDPDILRAKAKVFVELYLRGEQIKEQAIELAVRRQRQEELERASELEQRLLAIVGHDVRNPLTAILTATKLELSRGTASPEQARTFQRIARAGERINTIVGLLVDFTRVSLGGGIPVSLEPGELREVCTGVLDEFRTIHPRRTFQLHVPDRPIEGCWDANRLAQVVTNLVDNAVKYGAADAPIEVTVDAEEAPGPATIRVRNQGDPIPPERAASLFEPFRRGTEGDRHHAISLGLGLYIADEIVRAHHGMLSVHSDAHATEFTIQLPRGTEQPGCDDRLSA